MRRKFKYFLGSLALLAMALPLWARTDQMMLHLDKTTMVGMTQLAPGDYQVKADEAKKDLKVLQNNSVVADVQGHWVSLPQKPDYDQSVVNGNRLTQVEFEGQAESFVIG